MSGRVVAIGEPALIRGYALAGVELVAAESPGLAAAAWDHLGEDVDLVLLTPAAYEELAERLMTRQPVIWTTIPT